MSGAAAAWSLDREAFERLLAFLDPDREIAAEKYEEVRRRLQTLFSWRGCEAADECADRTIDRVARLLLKGADVRVAEPYQYFHGVALNVLREYWRDGGRAAQTLDATGVPEPAAPSEIDSDTCRLAQERSLECLEACLRTIGARPRALLLEYHAGGSQIARRKALAESLGIGLNALRIRVHRIRSVVEASVARCMSRE